MNKSSHYNFLSIQIVSKTTHTATYVLAHAANKRPYTWKAVTGKDRMVLDTVEVGRRYSIKTESDQYGTQHWIAATATDQPKVTTVKKGPPKPPSNDQLAAFMTF